MSSNAEVLQQIADRLRQQRWSLAVAESLTGGNVQALITSISGASDYFRGGVVAYDVDRKIELLGVDAATAVACDGVSAEVAEQMAKGIARLFHADCAIATTGYAEPALSRNVKTPFAFCTIVVPSKDGIRWRTERCEANGDRVGVQGAIAQFALNMLRQSLPD